MRLKKIIGYGVVVIIAALLGRLATYPLNWITEQFVVLFPGLNVFIYKNILLLLSAGLLLMLFIVFPRTIFASSLIAWLVLCPWSAVAFVFAITIIIIAIKHLIKEKDLLEWLKNKFQKKRRASSTIKEILTLDSTDVPLEMNLNFSPLTELNNKENSVIVHQKSRK